MGDIVVDRRPFSRAISTFLMYTFLVGAQEISINVLDRIGEGRGDVARALMEAVGKNRRKLDLTWIDLRS